MQAGLERAVDGRGAGSGAAAAVNVDPGRAEESGSCQACGEAEGCGWRLAPGLSSLTSRQSEGTIIACRDLPVNPGGGVVNLRRIPAHKWQELNLKERSHTST